LTGKSHRNYPGRKTAVGLVWLSGRLFAGARTPYWRKNDRLAGNKPVGSFGFFD
jgi:hypothetical protein